MAETKFKIYSLLVVKNEADIIRSSLMDACRWSNKIIVLDNGSTDGTWEIVQELSHTYPQVIAFGQDTRPFNIGMRARLFRAFRHEMSRNDWWCVRLDADEFYPNDVHAFLAAVPSRYTTVAKESHDYLLSEQDLPHLTGDFEQDRPLIQHLLPHHRRERRFMRHAPWLIWLNSWRYPHPWGRVYERGIPVDHYQYRSIEQMQQRWQTRAEAKQNGCRTFRHENKEGWQSYLWENQPLDLPSLFEQATHVIKIGRNEIREINHIVIKSFQVPTGWKRLLYSFLRKSKAQRSYEYAQRLQGLTPAPIAYQEVKRHDLMTRSYYACQLSTCPYTFKDLRDPSFPNRQQHLQAIARFTAQLHHQGILHADYSQGNILFDDLDHIEIVDLNRIRFRCVSIRQGVRNLQRLRLIGEEDFQNFVQAYRQARHELFV